VVATKSTSRQTRQAVCAIQQSIFNIMSMVLTLMSFLCRLDLCVLHATIKLKTNVISVDKFFKYFLQMHFQNNTFSLFKFFAGDRQIEYKFPRSKPIKHFWRNIRRYLANKFYI
jgi:hypothetical protein